MTADLIVAHYNEDLSWLGCVDGSKFNTVIVSKTHAQSQIYQPENKGFEASAYLEYIARNYDTLPEFCVFVHGHQRSWHHLGDLSDLVNSLPLCAATGYRNFNHRQLNEPQDGFFNLFLDQGQVASGHEAFLLWQVLAPTLFAHVGGLQLPDNATFRHRACAQFVVHRDLIRRYSKIQWEGLLEDFLISCRKTSESSKTCACCYEWSWSLLMTGWCDEQAWDERHDWPPNAVSMSLPSCVDALPYNPEEAKGAVEDHESPVD